MKSWGSGQAKKFARDVVIGETYWTISEQSAHARTYGAARTVHAHTFTSRSLVTGQAMTEGRTSALALCRNQGPVYDTEPRVEKVRERKLNDKDTDKRARGFWG